MNSPEPGDFVELRGRPWLVEALLGNPGDLQTVSLSCISDDAQGEHLEILWDAEIGATILDDDGWKTVGTGLPDNTDILAAHIRAIRWRSATAADRDLFRLHSGRASDSTHISCYPFARPCDYLGSTCSSPMTLA